jgi:hypothetical protein
MRILLTGATGFLGGALCRALVRDGHEVTALSRDPARVASRCGPAVCALRSLGGSPSDLAFDAVVNLAGAPIADRRWTAARKRELRESRVDATRALTVRLSRLSPPPAVLLSASAIGYYGDAGERVLGEDSPAGEDFLSGLCADWEGAARSAGEFGARVCLLRTGLVLHPSGGVLARMLPPFRLGLGGRVGDGRQWMSWIQLDDWVALTLRLLSDASASGPFNLTAPEPATNAAFTAALGRALRRPAPFPVPARLLRLLLGERASLLLASQRVLPQRAEALGYRFRYASLDDALSTMLN